MQTVSRRGLRQLPQLSVRSSFPLGLFEQTRRLDEARTILVLPRIRRLSRRVVDDITMQGSVSHRWERSGEEYYGLREYVPGDDPRMISWRVSARAGELIVREMDPGTARAVVIEFDPRVPADYDLDAFEDCVDLAASMASAFLEHEHQVALAIPGRAIGLGLGQKHLMEILKALAHTEAAAFEESAPSMPEEGDWQGAAHVVVSANPARWGERLPSGRILDPYEALER
jgi:uncharacterized protein (DUF58 family)